jgi:F-type H+-transporting ATPase subunit gamma
MANLREIKRRITSVKNTGKITRAMQLVAASRMKKAQEAAILSRPYATMLAEMLSAMPRNESGELLTEGNPFLTTRAVKTRGVLLVSTDKGLAGALNSNLFRYIATELPGPDVRFVAIGRKGAQFLARTGRKLVAQFSVSDNVAYPEVRPVVDMLMESYKAGEIDTIEVLFPRFVNNLRQDVTLTKLVPIPNLENFIEANKKRDVLKPAPIADDHREMVFEPATDEILTLLVDLYIRREIHQMVQEARASELSARMVAMKTATDNAHELERRLTLTYNKARQAAITQELVELSAASAAAQN